MKSLLDLAKEDGLAMRRASNTNGGEYAGPCPACGGNDRFHVWPETGRFWCRGCGAAGDEIDYLRQFHGMTFQAACEALGRDLDPSLDRCKAKVERPAWTPRETILPPDSWQTKAEALTAWAEARLWSDECEAVRGFLHGRGLTDATIRAARLGWNPKDVWRDREAWGLPVELKEDGTAKRLWIPAGLVIPNLTGGKVSRIRIRRPEGDPRYYMLPGSETSAMVLGEPNPCLVVESELDAILTNQEAGEIVTSIALGSSSARPDQATAGRLNEAELILIALDSDEAGAKESWRWWPEHFPQARRWPLPGFKDPSEAYRGGFPLRTWIEAGLAEYTRETAPQSTQGPDPLPFTLPEDRSAVLGEMSVNTPQEQNEILGLPESSFKQILETVPVELAQALTWAAEVFPDATLEGFEAA